MADQATSTTTDSAAPAADVGEKVKFTLNYKKNNYPLEWPLDDTLANLRIEVAKLTGVTAGLQKLMLKGIQVLIYMHPVSV